MHCWRSSWKVECWQLLVEQDIAASSIQLSGQPLLAFAVIYIVVAAVNV